MNPEHAANTSIPAALVAPICAWIKAPVDGIIWSGVVVAQTIMSMSVGSSPARSNACNAARVPNCEVYSLSAAL